MERLYRSKSNRVIAGVCGGFAEYFRIDPTIIRIIWILIGLAGAGLPAYIIAAIIMPDEDKVAAGKSEWKEPPKAEEDSFTSSFESEQDNWEQPVKPKYDSERNRYVLGAILVGLGILFLGNQIIPRLFELKYLVPILLIGIGGFIVFRRRH